MMGLLGFRRGTPMAALLTVGILAIGFAVFKAHNLLYQPAFLGVDPHTTPFWGPAGLNAYFARQVGMYDSTAQRLAVRVDLLALAFLLALAPYLKRFLPVFEQSRWQRATGAIVACAFL